MEWVSRIDLIAGGNMFLWGVFDGAIVSITTKTGDELDQALAVAPAIDVSIASPLGYQTPAEFYAPAYATEKARRSMVPDYRTTLYWNPSVEFDETGRATVEFYTSDAPADYDISIEGVTQTGKIVQRRQRLRPEFAAGNTRSGFLPNVRVHSSGKACIFDCIQILPLGNVQINSTLLSLIRSLWLRRRYSRSAMSK